LKFSCETGRRDKAIWMKIGKIHGWGHW
jgi:hypothetical protein